MRWPNKSDVMLLIAYLMLFVVLTWVLCGCAADTASTAHADDDADYSIQAPFDAHRYDPPEWWGDCEEVLEVADTRTNQRWWVLRMNRSMTGSYAESDNYIVMPIEPTGDMG